MKIDRTKNSVRNIIMGFLNKFVMLLVPFIIRTIIIYLLGTNYVGLNSLFVSILTVLSLAELGFGSAVVFFLYKPVAENDTETICAILNLYRKIYFVIGTIILLLGLGLGPFLQYFIKKDVPPDINIYVLYGMYLANTVATYFFFGYKNAILKAVQRNDIISNITTVVYLAMYSLQIVILFLTRNYYVYVVLIPIFNIVLNIAIAIYTKKKYPQYIPRGKNYKVSKKEIKRKVSGLMMSKIGAATRNTFDSIVISAFIGLTQVGIYNNYYYILTALAGIFAVVLNSILAGVGNSIAVESREKNYHDFRIINFMYMLISGAASVCLVTLTQPFMEIWVGTEAMFPTYISLLFCFYFYLLRQGDISSIYFNAIGLWWKGKWRYLIEAVLNLVLNIVLGKFFGVLGIIVATIATILCFSYLYGSTFIFKYYFGQKHYWHYIWRNVIYFVVTLIAAALAYYLCSLITISGSRWVLIGAWFIKLLVSVIVAAVIFYLAYFRTKIYKNSIQWVKLKKNYLLRNKSSK